MTRSTWRLPALWWVVALSVAAFTWNSLELPYGGLWEAARGLAVFELGRQFEREHRVHKRIRATLRSKPIVAARAATDPQMRRIHHADRPSLPPADPR